MRKEFQIHSSLQRLLAWWNGISQMKIWERIDGDYGNVQKRMFEWNLSFNSCLRRFRAQRVIRLRFELKKGDFHWNVIGRSQGNFMHMSTENRTPASDNWQINEENFNRNASETLTDNEAIEMKIFRKILNEIDPCDDVERSMGVQKAVASLHRETKASFSYWRTIKYVVANSNLSIMLANVHWTIHQIRSNQRFVDTAAFV